jgi:imidazolonepropionase-like amidohydrolase
MELIHANLYTCEPETGCIQDGYLRIADGKIAALGKMSEYTPSGEEVIDCSGKTIYPGFIDAHCHIGMWEDGLTFEGDDGNEATNPITPQLRAIDAINPMDRCYTEAVEGGITTVLTGPGSANPIGGSWVAMKTYGKSVDQMTFIPNVGMKFAFGENPKNVYNGRHETPSTRMATAALIREALTKAKRYLEKQERAAKDPKADQPDYDAASEALLPVLRREIKAFMHCHRADDILTALRITKEFNLDTVLVHCTEGYLIADILKQENAKIITGPIISDRSKPELRNQTPANPGLLSKAGISCAICTDHPVIPIQYLPLSAGICVKEGLSHDQAILALTYYPAALCGISDKVGSLKVGKDADLTVYADDPLSVYAKPELVFIDGVCRSR